MKFTPLDFRGFPRCWTREEALLVDSSGFWLWDQWDEAQSWGSWTGLDALELGDGVFGFMADENDDHRWNRLELLGQSKWVKW